MLLSMMPTRTNITQARRLQDKMVARTDDESRDDEYDVGEGVGWCFR